MAAEEPQVTPERRVSPSGAILRAGLAAVERSLDLSVPDGRQAIAVLVVNRDGVTVGGATRTKRGWVLQSALEVAVREGRVRDVEFRSSIVF